MKLNFISIIFFLITNLSSSLESAKENSSIFWKKNMDRQRAETFFDIIEENQKQKSLTLKKLKMYKNPIISAVETNNAIRTIKKTTQDIRENIKEKYNINLNII